MSSVYGAGAKFVGNLILTSTAVGIGTYFASKKIRQLLGVPKENNYLAPYNLSRQINSRPNLSNDVFNTHS